MKEVIIMLGITNYEAFIITCIIVNITPGADTIYLLSRSISLGRKAGIYSMIGILLGCGIHTILVALGLSIILAKSAMAFMTVKTIGAIYLAYLGISALYKKDTTILFTSQTNITIKNTLIQGLLTNLLNPKVSLFFLSFLPQFITPNSNYGIIPFIALGSTFIFTSTIWLLILILCSANITSFLRNNETSSKLINKLCGCIYLALGVKLLTTEK